MTGLFAGPTAESHDFSAPCFVPQKRGAAARQRVHHSMRRPARPGACAPSIPIGVRGPKGAHPTKAKGNGRSISQVE